MIRPLEPRQQRREIARLDRGAAPEAQAGRRVAIAGDVVGHSLRGEAADQGRDQLRLASARQRAHQRVDQFQADRGRGAGLGATRQERDPGGARDPGGDQVEIGRAARDQRGKPADPLGPGEPIERVLDREHRGRVDRLAAEDAFDQLALGGQAQELGRRPGRLPGRQALHRARERISMPCWASPPSTFCQE